ncbi:hypothetical protein [Roseitranquillus sediminis]|uniref:hypothetical protein n=1 Tax=Roseitranquillus sediminis TaxID=2809051 RepID=UPI001D0CC6A9|nr:hypothetical protein [Roseitranquillus sediminis]
MFRIAALALAMTLPTLAQAGLVENACLRSDRGPSRSLCGCIQQVANATLDRRDQRLAASFFADPHRSQVVRQSSRRSDEVFWQRYKRFGATAEAHCARR